MKVLALDVSGSCTGWSFGIDGHLEGYGKFISKTSGSRGKRLFEFGQWIEVILDNKKPDIIVIEKPYKGRNSNVLANLSKFISVVELAAYKVLALELDEEWFIDPKSVKKALKVKKGKDYNDNKRLMVAKINNLYGLKLKYGLNKSKSYNDDDIADGIALL